MDLKELYETNADFRRYVDRHIKCYNLSLEDALEHELVRRYAEYVTEEGERNEKL